MDIRLNRGFGTQDLVVNRAPGFSQDYELKVGPFVVELSHWELKDFLRETLAIMPSFKVSDQAWEEVENALS